MRTIEEIEDKILDYKIRKNEVFFDFYDHTIKISLESLKNMDINEKTLAEFIFGLENKEVKHLDKQELFKHVETEFHLVINEQLSNSSRNTILCNLMNRLEKGFNNMPIMSAMSIPEVKQYFLKNPKHLKIKRLYDEISNARI